MKQKTKDLKAEIDMLKKQTDESIDYSDIKELDDNFWNNAEWKPPMKKERITIRIDSDIISFFKCQGKGYQTYINSVLRSFMNSKEKNKKTT